MPLEPFREAQATLAQDLGIQVSAIVHDHEHRSAVGELRALLPNSMAHISPTGSHDWIITHPAEFAAAGAAFAGSPSPATPLP